MPLDTVFESLVDVPHILKNKNNEQVRDDILMVLTGDRIAKDSFNIAKVYQQFADWHNYSLTQKTH